MAFGQFAWYAKEWTLTCFLIYMRHYIMKMQLFTSERGFASLQGSYYLIIKINPKKLIFQRKEDF